MFKRKSLNRVQICLSKNDDIQISASQSGPSGPQVGLWIFEMGLKFSLGLQWTPRKMYGWNSMFYLLM